MCEFCAKHGEGRKWYLEARNYSEDRVRNSKRFRRVMTWLVGETIPGRKKLARARTFLSIPLIGRAAGSLVTRRMKKDHFGQVLPLEDVKEVFRLAEIITCFPCVCRRALGVGNDQRYCFVLGNFMRALLDDGPDLDGKGDPLTVAEATSLAEQFEQQGLIHTIWTVDTPFVVGICSCRPGECLAMEMTNSLKTKVMFKAESLFEIDASRCIGCRKCREACYFDAIEWHAREKLCATDPAKCYGCGLCRAACPVEAPARVPRIGRQTAPSKVAGRR